MDMTFSSPRDINIKAAGSVNITGNNVNMIARERIDIVSALRGITMKAQTWFDMACEKGCILIQSFMPDRKETPKINDSEDEHASTKLDAAFKSLTSGIILRTNTSNIVLDAGYKTVFVNCLHYINSAIITAFNSLAFLIKDIVNFNKGVTTFTSGAVNLKNLYANSISNRSAGKVATTKQEGLTLKHKDDLVNAESTKIDSLTSSIKDESALAILEKALDSAANKLSDSERPSFDFGSNTDELCPIYDTHYQTISEQILASYNKDVLGEYYTTDETWDSIFSQAPHTGRPIYPPSAETKKGYLAQNKIWKPSEITKNIPNPSVMIPTPNDYFTKIEVYNKNSFL